MIRKITIGTSVIVAIATLGYVLGVYSLVARAAISVFYPSSCYTAAATSTLSYMTAGKATTTVTCPMGSDGARTAVLQVQVNASSSAATFNVYAEESMDGMDWYPIVQDQTASTSAPFNAGVRQYSTFTFASSTIGGVDVATGLLGASTTFTGYASVNNRNHYLIDIPVRMKQVRAYIALAAGNAGVWMQIQPRVDAN